MRNPSVAFLAGWTTVSPPGLAPAASTAKNCPVIFAEKPSLQDPSSQNENGGEVDEKSFLLEQLAYLEAIGEELDEFDDLDEADYFMDESEGKFLSIEDEHFDDLFEDIPEEEDLAAIETELEVPINSAKSLEQALLQGVVPAGAGVGSECLPGDWDFDPLGLATKDYIGRAQRAIIRLIPGGDDDDVELVEVDRPTALILRDYREAEIRHGRLAMLASIFWPLQEMLDRLLLDESQFGSLVHGTGITLPYIPLLMTAIMMLLGYLDVYSKAIKELDEIGEAFLPGDCFWDPLSMLQGAPDRMKRNMQERELLNGRMAMLAVAVYFWEEFTTHQPLISIEGNELLFVPFYEVPFIQQWLDSQFQTPSPTFLFPEAGGQVDFVEMEAQAREQVQ